MFKKILAYALTICLLLSFTVSAYAADEVYTVLDDTAALSAPIFYTPDYYPGAVAEMRSSGLFANFIAHGSYSELNYNPSWFYKSGSSYPSGDFNALTPSVTADQTDVSGIYCIPNTTFLSGSLLAFRLPSTDDCYFDFQSSNFLFDQQSPQANTFYINGDLTFSLRNLWSFNGSNGDGVSLTDSWYLASDPLAVQLVIDGKAYGDIIDVTSYNSPFTALYNGGVPSNATVTFNNLKVYYQGDTPDMIGFRVYTGSAFTDGQYNYNNAGQFIAVDVTNTVTFRCSEIPDITFVQEGGDGYAGDLSGISGLLSSILSTLSNGLLSGSRSYLDHILSNLRLGSGYDYLKANGTIGVLDSSQSLIWILSRGFLGLRSLFVDSSGAEWGSVIDSSIQDVVDNLYLLTGYSYLGPSGNVGTTTEPMYFVGLIRRGFLGLREIILDGQEYVSDTVFPWQSYNMETHQLNTATNITGQNNLFFTAFQSIEDKLGRLAYVFGSDEDLALKAESEPALDSIRENFGSGPSLSDIADVAEVTTVLPNMFDAGIGVSDGFEFISDEKDSILSWFTYDTLYALDSTSRNRSSVSADVNLDTYNSNMDKVNKYRNWGDADD